MSDKNLHQKYSFLEYMELRGYSDNTKYQYQLMQKKLLNLIYANNELLDQSIANKFIAEHNHLPARAFLKAFFDYGDRDDLEVPPLKGRQLKRKLKYLEYEEVLELENHADLREKLLLRLMFESGLRISETINLRIKDIDFSSNKISGIGKGNLEFNEELSDKTAKLLKEYTKGRQGYVFNIGRRWASKLIKRLGFEVLNKDIHPHMLRHSYGTFLRSKGYDLKQIQELLRHKKLETTGIYTHVDSARLRREKLKLFTR